MRYSRIAGLTSAGALLAISLGGCQLLGGGDGPQVRSINELDGSYRGVALGDPPQAALQALGKPDERESSTTPAMPIGSIFSDGGPLSQPNPPGYDLKPSLLRYQDVAFVYTPTQYGIHSIVIDDPHAATQKGVGIGDPLSHAPAAYPNLRCNEEQDAGDYGSFPAYCSGRLAANRYIWFGGDPIRVIAIGRAPME
jgi:hypothetical protein